MYIYIYVCIYIYIITVRNGEVGDGSALQIKQYAYADVC